MRRLVPEGEAAHLVVDGRGGFLVALPRDLAIVLAGDPDAIVSIPAGLALEAPPGWTVEVRGAPETAAPLRVVDAFCPPGEPLEIRIRALWPGEPIEIRAGDPIARVVPAPAAGAREGAWALEEA